MFLRNVGIYLQVHTALQPRRPTAFVKTSNFILLDSVLVEPQLEKLLVKEISSLVSLPARCTVSRPCTIAIKRVELSEKGGKHHRV
jgi:hypothetical protein